MISQSDHKPGRNCPFRQLCRINQANRSIWGPIYGSWQLWSAYCTSDGTQRPVVDRRDRLATTPSVHPALREFSRLHAMCRKVPSISRLETGQGGDRHPPETRPRAEFMRPRPLSPQRKLGTYKAQFARCQVPRSFLCRSPPVGMHCRYAATRGVVAGWADELLPDEKNNGPSGCPEDPEFSKGLTNHPVCECRYSAARSTQIIRLSLRM